MPAMLPAISPCIHQESPAVRAARVHARIAGVLDAEHFRVEKAARCKAHEEARAGLLSKPDTFHSVRAEACKATGMVYSLPMGTIDFPPANNVKMQHSGRSIWPGSRTKEADHKSNLSAWRKPRDKELKRLEQLPVRQVAAQDEL